MKKVFAFLSLFFVLTAFSLKADDLIIPSVAYSPGFNNSFWKTSVSVYNDTDAEQTVSASILSGEGEFLQATLQPSQYLFVDNLGSLFNLGYGSFVVKITRSDSRVLINGKTYNSTENSTEELSTLLFPLNRATTRSKIIFTRLTGARKALFFYGKLNVSCSVDLQEDPVLYANDTDTFTRIDIPENTLVCSVTNAFIGGPSGGDEETYHFVWASEADNVNNDPTLLISN